MGRLFFILNPAAGHGRAVKLWERFERSWKGPQGWALGRTERRGHASELARDALKWGFDRILAVGGDGTLSEAAHGILTSGRELPPGFALGHFPVGSGCDFSRHFGLPRKPEGWGKLLKEGRLTRVDAGRATWMDGNGERVERIFVNIAMAGLAGDIAHAMDRSGKPLGGTASYLAISLAYLLRSRPREMRLSFDGGKATLGRYHMLALANTSSTGGGMKIAPQADAGDGFLDLVAVRGLNRLKLLWHFPKIYAGSHLSVNGIECSRVRSVEAASEGEVLLNIDGEPLGRLPARFEILPKALPVLLP